MIEGWLGRLSVFGEVAAVGAQGHLSHVAFASFLKDDG